MKDSRDGTHNVTKFISIRSSVSVHLCEGVFKRLSWIPAPSHPMAPDGHADVVVSDRLAAALNVFTFEART